MRLSKVTQVINGLYRILCICFFLKAIRSRQQFMEVMYILYSLVKLCSFLTAEDCTTLWKSYSSVIRSQTRLVCVAWLHLCLSPVTRVLPAVAQELLRCLSCICIYGFFCFPNSNSHQNKMENSSVSPNNTVFKC